MPKNEVAVITGTGAGVGRAIVNEFADHGAHIGVISRNRERLEAAGRYVEERGGKALVLPCDVAQSDTFQHRY